MTARLRTICIAACLAVAACKAPTAVPADDGTGLAADFAQTTLRIDNDRGERLDFDVYLAMTPEQHRRGLMHVRSMPRTTGMLFVYAQPGIKSMWMKNTYIPLDLVFVRSDGSVASVIANAAPLTLASRASTEPVSYVLELNGGVAAQLSIGRNSHLHLEDALDEPE